MRVVLIQPFVFAACSRLHSGSERGLGGQLGLTLTASLKRKALCVSIFDSWLLAAPAFFFSRARSEIK